jgi:hypothetical protein
MKKRLFFIAVFLYAGCALFAQVGISSDNGSPDPSAGLEVKFSDRGFLPPKVALSAANIAEPVVSPATGLFIYNTSTGGTPPNNVTPGYYCWNGTRWVAVSVPTGTNPGDMLYWNGTQWVGVPAGSNGQVLTFNNGVPGWSRPAFSCGSFMTINHTVAGNVAPVNKTVSYGTAANILGEPNKCWITSNLGASRQAPSMEDDTELSAGWYWQFNRRQGYRNTGGSGITPSWTISSINENSDWLAANDPCAIELGSPWRIPTYTEWYDVDAIGGWTNWSGPWYSGLKLHPAGYIDYSNGSLYSRGTGGYYWSSTQYISTHAWHLDFVSGGSYMSFSNKASGFTIRCVRDY